jgi:hypothetical protein
MQMLGARGGGAGTESREPPTREPRAAAAGGRDSFASTKDEGFDDDIPF